MISFMRFSLCGFVRGGLSFGVSGRVGCRGEGAATATACTHGAKRVSADVAVVAGADKMNCVAG